VNPEDEVLAVLVRVARALEHAQVEYMVGGSVASSLHGEPRATRDIDFAVRLREEALPRLVAALGQDFAIDEQMVKEAIQRGRSANIFYLPFFMKVDLFVRGSSEYDEAEFARKAVVEPTEGEPLFASSVEDTLLWKLRWFRMGGEVSDHQWRDVLGMLRLAGDALDRGYLRHWSAAHGVSDLLD
jgi:hypothetical protein